MENQVISSPPIVVQGLIGPVTGVLEYLRILSHLCFCLELTVKFACFLPMLSTGRNKKLRTGAFP